MTMNNNDTDYFFFLADAYVECQRNGEVLFVEYWGWNPQNLYDIIRNNTDIFDVCCKIISDDLLSKLNEETQECRYTQKARAIA